MLHLLRFFLLASLASASLGCPGSSKPVTSPETAPAAASDAQTVDAIEALADKLQAAALADEPAVTATLEKLARDTDGELVGLEHRLKKRPSMIRKLRLQEGERPIEEITISDALRYTMRIEDQPPGSHVASIVKVVAALESSGHRVVKLKNYWPKGDNYSGVNSVLQSSSGLQWELQFHTSASLQVQKATRDAYEELRLETTPVERKRELFDLMTSSWDEVLVPLDILDPHSLHATEQIIERPRP